MCSSHLGSCLIRVSILGMQSLLSGCEAIRRQVASGHTKFNSRGGRWRSLGRRVKPASALAGADETGSADQRWTLAVERPLGNEKLHGNGVIARSPAHALVALMRQINLAHVDLDTEAGPFGNGD